MNVYAVVHRDHEVYGHGSYGTRLVIRERGLYDGSEGFPPLFVKKEAAEAYLCWLAHTEDVSHMEIAELSIAE